MYARREKLETQKAPEKFRPFLILGITAVKFTTWQASGICLRS